MERWDKVTMAQVSNLIEKNRAFSIELELRLSFGVTDKKFYGAIFNGDNQIFYKTYEGEHAHLLIAMIHTDFAEHLKKIDIARKRAESVRLQIELNAAREKEAEDKWHIELERRKAAFNKNR